MPYRNARAEARAMLDEHDAEAMAIIEARISTSLAEQDADEALRLDQVRRELAKLSAAE